MLPELFAGWLLGATQSSRFCFPDSVCFDHNWGRAGTPVIHLAWCRLRRGGLRSLGGFQQSFRAYRTAGGAFHP
jgi:hypothetical protein